jgi:hypothetical protein
MQEASVSLAGTAPRDLRSPVLAAMAVAGLVPQAGWAAEQIGENPSGAVRQGAWPGGVDGGTARRQSVSATHRSSPGEDCLRRPRRYIGYLVLHGHCLDHEDEGMMQNVRIALPDGMGGIAASHH